MKSVFLGADHAGFKLKEDVKGWLEKQNYLVHDVGAYKLEDNDDYPDFAAKLGEAVSEAKNGMGILFCGSGQGMCIAANKIRGIRAVCVADASEAKLSRQHLNSNVLCLSGWNLKEEKARSIIKSWLDAPFSEAARHNRRIRKIAKLEK